MSRTTKYVVFGRDEHGDFWRLGPMVEAHDAEQAVRRVAAPPGGEFVAIAERSWRPFRADVVHDTRMLVRPVGEQA